MAGLADKLIWLGNSTMEDLVEGRGPGGGAKGGGGGRRLGFNGRSSPSEKVSLWWFRWGVRGLSSASTTLTRVKLENQIIGVAETVPV